MPAYAIYNEKHKVKVSGRLLGNIRLRYNKVQKGFKGTIKILH
jgi:hypothetical protein